MNKNPIVSIITPTYNIEKYIGKCIESVLAQSFSEWEQIIIDDGSSDGTQEIIEKYLSDKRIRYLRLPHRGIEKLGETYNRALSLAKGDFIAILEGDDFWPPDKLEKQIKLFSNSRVVLAWGLGKFVDEKDRVLSNCLQAWKKWPEDVICNRPVGRALKVLSLFVFTEPAVTVMLRRKPLLEIGGFWQPEGVYYVDLSTWLKMALKGEFAYSKELLGYWRIHSQQTTSTSANRVSATAGQIFWNSLSEDEKRKLGIENLGGLLKTKVLWIRGKRAMVRGERKVARQIFLKLIFKSQGIVCLKAAVVLTMSFLIPSLLQSRFSTAGNFSVWLRKKVLKL